jgi:hypothetical protein
MCVYDTGGRWRVAIVKQDRSVHVFDVGEAPHRPTLRSAKKLS